MEQLKLRNQLCFPVYALSRKITACYRPLLEEIDLTYPQYLVMLLLWEQKKITVKAIGDQLYLDSGTLTPLLKRLEQKGLVTRKRNETDERVLDVAITTKGTQLQQKGRHIPHKLMNSLHLSEEKLNRMRKTIDQLLLGLEQAG